MPRRFRCQYGSRLLVCVVLVALEKGCSSPRNSPEVPLLLKRFLIMMRIDSVLDAAVARHSRLTADTDIVILVCSDGEANTEETNAQKRESAANDPTPLREFEVQLPAFAPVGAKTCCGEAWSSSQKITRVMDLNGTALHDMLVLRTHSCSPHVAEFILSVAALTGPAYAFYLPLILDSTQSSEALRWLQTFHTDYPSVRRREEMAHLGILALRQRTLALASTLGLVSAYSDLPSWPPACAASTRNLLPSDGDVKGGHLRREGDEKDRGEGRDGAARRGKRFVYLATGETEESFRYGHELVSGDADAIFCVWGKPPPMHQPTLTCHEECTGDAKQICRQVCRRKSASGDTEKSGGSDMNQVHFIYVAGSSFQQGRNHLYLEAQRRGDYAYFIFLVDDVSVVEVDFGTGLLTENPFRTLEQYLITWQPAVGVSGAARRDDDHHMDPSGEVQSIYGFDHLLMAVHRDAADALLPYSLQHEDESWWYSEYVVNVASAALFPNHVLQFNAVFAETYRAGYVGYPHASDFTVPLTWMLPAFGRKEQLNGLHAHEHTCLTPTDPLTTPHIGPHTLGYTHIWHSLDFCNPCHPYFFFPTARKRRLAVAAGVSHTPLDTDGRACREVNMQVADLLMSLLEEEQERDGTVCGWCLLHPKSPLTSNCANRLSGMELPLHVPHQAQLSHIQPARRFSVEQQLRLHIDDVGNPL